MPHSPPVHSIKQSEQSRLQGQKEYNRTKRENQDFYSSGLWTRVSKQYRKTNPLCVMCKSEGRATPAQCVDHIIEIKDGGSSLEASNLQSLCYSHHNTKSSQERQNRNN